MTFIAILSLLMAAADIPDSITIERDITYASVHGKDLKLDVYWHREAAEPLPLIVWIHGGAWKGGNKENPRAYPLLSRGYAIASVQYRLSREAIFPAQIHDCKAAIRWLRANASTYNFDPNRIGAWGGSAGGHLVALLGTTGDTGDLEGDLGITDVSSRVQAVCDWFGPTDFLRMNDVPGKIDHDAPDSPESKLVGAAIQDHPERVDRANLILHGSQDFTVLKNQSELLHTALQRAGVSSNLILIDDQGHGFRSSKRNPEDVLRHVEAFFDRELKQKTSEWTGHAENPHPWVTDFGRNEVGSRDVLFYSEKIGGYYGYTIYLPPSYDGIEKEMYPAVYWLHGRNGRPHGANRFIARAHTAMEAGLCPEMIIVAPTGLQASMYVDSKDGAYPVESVIVNELIPHIESTYRVIPNREMRAIDGFSMGGFGAAHLGFKHPEIFGTISLMGAAVHRPEFFRDERSDIFTAVFGDDLSYCEKESPWTLVRKNADLLRGRTTMRLFVGANDIRLRGKNMEFSTFMETFRLSHEYGVVPQAGHNVAQVLDGMGDEAWTFYQRAFKVG